MAIHIKQLENEGYTVEEKLYNLTRLRKNDTYKVVALYNEKVTIHTIELS